MPSYLTKKQKEAIESCEKMKTSFDNLDIQINVDHTDGAIPLKDKLNLNQPLIDYGHSEFNSLDTNSNVLDLKSKDVLQEAINMNNVPSS